ncbi:chaplin [Streptomyces piniterrae]|uniref:Chaplin n=1 Tax=Streptomyces piniterrae TaxID=2571125 RepID=A0A4U0MQQ4_9ACTN|nr:chaplin [Streptomyces piniterrae]
MAASAATGGLLLASAGTTVADTGAQGAAVGSPGVVSGNVLQVPIHIPINACGNTVNIIGALNPALRNRCANIGGHGHHGHGKGRPHAQGLAAGSPGVLSGNLAQIPVHVPVNVCGNSGNGIGVLNPTFGNRCANVEGSGHKGKGHRHHHQSLPQKPEQQHDKPVHRHRPPSAPVHKAEVTHHRHQEAASPALPELARTGSERVSLAIPLSAGLMVGGILLYRRGRRAAARS